MGSISVRSSNVIHELLVAKMIMERKRSVEAVMSVPVLLQETLCKGLGLRCGWKSKNTGVNGGRESRRHVDPKDFVIAP